mmetsp:Transcript_1162/g.4341  ORF Transcript_1162/g.4341 Transcript_1162/m.4341 type:complete len:247 (-) Transcript_1162:670-1410(-)
MSFLAPSEMCARFRMPSMPWTNCWLCVLASSSSHCPMTRPAIMPYPLMPASLTRLRLSSTSFHGRALRSSTKLPPRTLATSSRRGLYETLSCTGSTSTIWKKVSAAAAAASASSAAVAGAATAGPPPPLSVPPPPPLPPPEKNSEMNVTRYWSSCTRSGRRLRCTRSSSSSAAAFASGRTAMTSSTSMRSPVSRGAAADLRYVSTRRQCACCDASSTRTSITATSTRRANVSLSPKTFTSTQSPSR